MCVHVYMYRIVSPDKILCCFIIIISLDNDNPLVTNACRKIIDGAGSGTVLNGNRRGQDLLYTMENYHISGRYIEHSSRNDALF